MIIKKTKKYIEYFFPIIISLLVIIIYLSFNKFNFRDSFLINDLETQYMGLMEYLKNVFEGKDSIFYSFSKGLGGNMISTVAYYLISPFNILVLFFDDVALSIAVGIFLRFCFCNLTFYIFLRYKYKSSMIITLIFSTIYAFNGYIVNYYFNIMWNDILILLPLIILQLDKLINGEKTPWLIILFSLSLLISFYMSYMVFIFAFIYTIYQLFLNNKNFNNSKQIIFRLIIYSLISFLVSSFILVPTIIDMKNNLFRYDTPFDLLNVDFSRIKMIISKLYIGSMNAEVKFSGTEANIYFSMIGIILLIKYFLNSKIKKREKLLTAGIFGIFFFSIIFEFINISWHGFSTPNGYNYRFTFLFVFFSLYIGFKQYTNNYKLNIKQILLINSIFIIVSIFMINQYSYLTTPQIIISIILFIIYTLLLNFNNNMIIFIIVLLELIINLSYSLITREKIDSINFIDFNYMNTVCKIANDNISNQRVSVVQINFANDPFSCNVKDVTMSMSTNNKLYFEFMSNIGYSVTYSTLVQNIDMSPFVRSILGVSKIIDYRFDLNEYDFLTAEDMPVGGWFDPLFTYNNSNALKIGYVVDATNIDYGSNVFENQNLLAKQMSGLDIDIFEPIEVTKFNDYNNQYKFTTQNNDDFVYFYNYFPIPANYIKYMWVYINEKNDTDIHSLSKGIHKFSVNKNKTNILSLAANNSYFSSYFNPLIYRFNTKNYQIIMDKLKKQQMDVEVFDKNKLKGTIELNNNETLMLSIPYEKGWIVTVNGKLSKYKKVYDAFIGLELDAGKNNINMVFIPPGFILGVILSIIGIFFTIINFKIKRL